MEVAVVSRKVFPLHEVGGLEKHTFYLITRLAQQGIKVELFCMDSEKEIPPELRHQNLEITFVPSKEYDISRIGYISFIVALRQYHSRLTAKDVVHFQKMVWGVPYGITLPGPLVYTPHGLEQFKHKALYKRMLLAPFNIFERVAARHSTRIVSLGPGNTREILEYLRISRDRVTEIPNGVDTTFFEPKPDPDVQTNDGWTILTVSRLIRYKGIEELIKAVRELAEGMEIELIVVGEGPERERLEELARGLPVRFTGYVEEERLPHFYSAADVFVLPTFGEGMPLTILEAMACGTPVVATRSGSIPDIVDDSVGVLVEPKSEQALETGLQRILSRDLETLSANCRKRVIEKYSWEAMVENTIDLYREITEE